jgi:hypothetical protein
MKITAVIAGLLFLLFVVSAPAGDAVVMGYRADGVWTAVTYIRSPDPRGGPHYHDATDAATCAQRDLLLRASGGSARTKVVDQSDITGYVTVMRGTMPTENKGLTTVGRGQSQEKADQDALNKLAANAATAHEKIVYRYFSYGSDAAEHAPAKNQSSHVQ